MKKILVALMEYKKAKKEKSKTFFAKIDEKEKKLRTSFTLKFFVTIILITIFGIISFFGGINSWGFLTSVALISLSWIYYCTKRIFLSTIIVAILFVVPFSIFQMKEDVLEIAIHSVSDKFVEEKHIEKETLESDIAGRINNIKDSTARSMEKTILENNKYSVKKDGEEKSTVLASGMLINNPGSEINIKIKDVGISLNSFLRSLKKNGWGKSIFGYKFSSVKGELIWKEEEQKWFLVFYYTEENLCVREAIEWNDFAPSKFSELALKYFSPEIILAYYYENTNNDELLKVCDKLIEKNIEVAKAYYYKGEVAYRLNNYEEALNFHNEAVKINLEKINKLTEKDTKNNKKEIKLLNEENRYFFVSRGWDLYGLNNLQSSLISFEWVINDIDLGLNFIKSKDLKDEQVRLGGIRTKALKGKAYVLEEKGEYQDSLEALDEAIEKSGQEVDDWLFHMRAYVKSELGRDDEALEDYERAISINSKYGLSYNNIGVIWDKRGGTESLEKAARFYGKAIEVDSSDPLYYRNKRQALIDLGHGDEVAKLLEKAEKSNADPKKASAWMNLGEIADDFEKENKALENYNKAIELYPKDAGFYVAKGDILNDYFKKYSEALVAYDKAIELNPNKASYYVNKGMTFKNSNKYPEALRAFDDAIFVNKFYARAYYGKALVYKKQRENDKAVDSFKEAIKYSPGKEDYHFELGNLLREMNKDEEALGYYKKAAKLDLDDKDNLYKVGKTLYDLKRYDEAIVKFDELIEIDHEHIDAHIYKGLALEENKKDLEALNIFNELISLDNKNIYYYRSKDRILNNLKYEDNVIRENYEKAMMIIPKNGNDYYNKAILLESRNLYKEALAAIKNAVRLNNNDPLKHEEMGDIQKSLGDKDGALVSYNKAIELDVESKSAYASKCILLNDMGQNAEALISCDKALVIDPEYGLAYHYRGFVLEDLSDYDGALGSFYDAIKFDPEDSYSMYAKARILNKKGRMVEALENLKRAIEINQKTKEWIEIEDDFDSIRENEEFKKIIE